MKTPIKSLSEQFCNTILTYFSIKLSSSQLFEKLSFFPFIFSGIFILYATGTTKIYIFNAPIFFWALKYGRLHHYRRKENQTNTKG